MSIKVIFGKPGSGKSYHCTKILVDAFVDWARYEKQTGERFNRVLYTNLPLNQEAVIEYIQKEFGLTFDWGYYVHLLDDSFFHPPIALDEFDARKRRKYKDWWEQFPDGCLIVIDEIHKYLGTDVSYTESIETNARLRDYMSQHRHKQHDWLIITQDLGNLNTQVKKMAEQAINIFNLKAMSLPFPISIPFEDVETLLKGFGVTRQVYRAKTGTFNGANRVVFDGPISSFVMEPKIFALYQSVTQLQEKDFDAVGDRALPFSTRWGAVMWFARRHVPHLTFKLGVCVFSFFMVKDVLLNLPTTLGNLATPKSSILSLPSASKQNDGVSSPGDDTTTKQLSSSYGSAGAPPFDPVENVGSSLPAVADYYDFDAADLTASAFFVNSAVVDGLRVKPGDWVKILHNGAVCNEKIDVIDARTKTISFQSGAAIRPPRGFVPRPSLGVLDPADLFDLPRIP